jgi:hypothetical protein
MSMHGRPTQSPLAMTSALLVAWSLIWTVRSRWVSGKRRRLILSCDVRTLNETAEGLECLAMLLNTEILAINQDPAVNGAKLLRAGADPSPPISSDDVTYQVFGRPLSKPGTFAAALLNRDTVDQNLTLSWAELGLQNPNGTANVRNVGAQANVGAFAGSWTVLVPARDGFIVTVTQ